MKQHSQNMLFEIPTINTSSQFICQMNCLMNYWKDIKADKEAKEKLKSGKKLARLQI